jgi:hypothetical protein
MKIQRFIRDNAKTMLMVVMALLLIAWLMPSGLFQGRGERASVQIGTAYDKPIMSHDAELSEQNRQIMAALRFPLPVTSHAMQLAAQAGALNGLREIEYMLLAREARQLGIRFSNDYARVFLTDAGMTPESLAAFKTSLKVREDTIYGAVAEWLAIVTVADQAAMAAVPTLPRLELAYRMDTEAAHVQYSALRAEALLKHVGEPNEADKTDLQALFEKGRDRTTAHTADELVFGFRRPARVQIEFLSVNPAELRATVAVSSTEARDYYNAHKDKYVRRVPRPSALDPNAEPEYEPVPLTFEEAETQVREDVRTQRVPQEAQRIVEQFRQKAARPWLAAGRDPNGLPNLPPADQLVSLAQLRDQDRGEHAVRYLPPAWLDEPSLQSSPVGRAVTRIGGQQVTGAQLAFRTGALAPRHEPNDPLPVLGVGEPSPLLLLQRPAFQQGMPPPPAEPYLFRVLAVETAGPPATLDAARDEVVHAWKVTRAYALAGEQMKALAEQARQQGLSEAVTGATALRAMLVDDPTTAPSTQPTATQPAQLAAVRALGPQDVERLTRAGAPVEGGTVPAKLAEAVFKVDADPNAPLAQRIVEGSDATQQLRAVVQVDSIRPPYRVEFDATRAPMYRRVTEEMQKMSLLSWFAPEAIHVRTHWEPPKAR